MITALHEAVAARLNRGGIPIGAEGVAEVEHALHAERWAALRRSLHAIGQALAANRITPHAIGGGCAGEAGVLPPAPPASPGNGGAAA